MSNSAPSGDLEVRALKQVICPHCWHTFRPGDILWIAEHTDLVGDPQLPEQPLRFLPSRFNPRGQSLDARGMACTRLACPKCHLPIPRPMLELLPLLMSIFGAPNSGKSFYLAAMAWELRRLLPTEFGLSITDTDAEANAVIRSYEEAVFLSSRADELVPLESLIRKTEQTGSLYNDVIFGTQPVSYPRPILFTLRNADSNRSNRLRESGRIICLYDNAGESFEPGQDKTDSPVTRHLAESRLLMFFYDPLQDARFSRMCHPAATGATSRDRLRRQEVILTEAIARVRRYANLAENDRHRRPLVVVVTKHDQWAHLLQGETKEEPFVTDRKGRTTLDAAAIEATSRKLRGLLQSTCADLVAAAESFALDVTYVPVSATGWATEIHQPTGLMGMRPASATPFRVTIPVLYGLTKVMPGWIPVTPPASAPRIAGKIA